MKVWASSPKPTANIRIFPLLCKEKAQKTNVNLILMIFCVFPTNNIYERTRITRITRMWIIRFFRVIRVRYKKRERMHWPMMRYAQKFHKIILKIFQNKLMPSTFCFILNQILRAFPAVGGIFIDQSPTLTQDREFLIFVATLPHLS